MAQESRSRKLLGLVVVAVVALAAAQLAGGVLSAFWNPAVTRADMEAELEKLATFRLIKQHLPEDYADAVDKLETVANTKGKDEIMAAAAEVGAGLRRKHADRVLAASADTIKRNIDNQLEFLRLIKTEKGDAFCGTFAQQGPIALAELKSDERFRAAFDRQGQLLWEAILVPAGAPRALAGDADWTAVAPALQASGLTDAQIGIVAEEKYQDASYCDAIIAFFTAVASLPGEAGERIRATMLVEIAKG